MDRPVPGLKVPAAWFGAPEPAAEIEVPTGEHGFHLCKPCSEEDALWIAAAPTAAVAKRRGGRGGEGGRRIELRPDWEDVRFEVMMEVNRRKYRFPDLRRALLETGERPLVEDSPYDFVWGGRDRRGGYGGRNLLGVVLMAVRAEIRGQARAPRLPASTERGGLADRRAETPSQMRCAAAKTSGPSVLPRRSPCRWPGACRWPCRPRPAERW
jgi:ribA/ribD-fused uncharacterized protein